jgi:hypothetical protein
MAIARKALPEDFDKTYPLLEKFNNVTLKRRDWEQLFANPWKNKEEHCGYILHDDGKVVGFLGTIFSERTIQGQQHKFCNVTSWIVEKEYRNQSFLLFLPLLTLKGYTTTIFSPNEASYISSKKLGFKDFETHNRVLLPFKGIRGLFESCSVVEDKKLICQTLYDECLRIYHDHQSFQCNHLFVKTKFGNFYLIATRVIKKNIPVAQIHFISDLGIFLKSLEIVRLKICIRLKVFMLLVDERFMRGKDVSFSFRMKLPQPRVFKSDFLKSNAIDSLYSELIVLNL